MQTVSILIVAVVPWALFGQQQDYTISTQSNLVILDVGVKDAAGRLVEGLNEDNFRVFEDGRMQKISDFSRRDEPVTIGLVIDNSGSMRTKRLAVNAAAKGFIEASNPRDEIFITDFNDTVRRGPAGVPFTDDRSLLFRALFRNPSEGRTALYDAVVESLHHLESGRQTKKALLVVSDGGDNASTHRREDVIRELHESLATIYTVGIYDDDDPDRNPGLLRRLAETSGGEAFFPKELDDLEAICRKIAEDIRHRYTIAYIPPDSSVHRIRKIRVEATAPGHGKLTIHARTSYMFPADAATREVSKK